MIPSFITVVLYYLGIINLGKEYLLVRSKSFILLHGAIMVILPFIVKSVRLVLLERTRDILTLPEQIWELANQQPRRNIILLLILVIILLVAYPIIWFYVTFFLPIRFLLHYLWNITSEFEKIDFVGVFMIALLQSAVAYFVFNYLNKRQVITNLTQALLELISIQEALLLEDTFGDTNLEVRFFNAIKYSHFEKERLLGLFSYYVPAPNVLYLKWLEEKRKSEDKKGLL